MKIPKKDERKKKVQIVIKKDNHKAKNDPYDSENEPPDEKEEKQRKKNEKRVVIEADELLIEDDDDSMSAESFDYEPDTDYVRKSIEKVRTISKRGQISFFRPTIARIQSKLGRTTRIGRPGFLPRDRGRST